MTEKRTVQPFLAAHPLVPAAALFLLGVACGRFCLNSGVILPAAGAGVWLLWLIAERGRRTYLAQAALALMLVLGGAGVWVLNQNHLERGHVARLVAPGTEAAAGLRGRVLVPPGADASGNQYWIAQADQVWTGVQWRPVSGEVMVQSPAGMALPAGAEVELYGWLARPEGALNPGAIDPARLLAADRVFAQLRVPRASGVMVRDASGARGSLLAGAREYLRRAMLAHTIQEDVPAAHTLTALLLGYRDPAMAEVSQSFADAGVAHLLAISGSHIVFFAALTWAVLRYVPLRPRGRELVIAAVVGLYVLATPCGPPIVRAAVALAMVLLGRLIGRPRAYLNMLAAAAVIVVILRPVDLMDAGFQLSFVTTAGLILFSTRIHAALFGGWLLRLELAAELSRRRAARWRLRLVRGFAGVTVANLIGALTAAPLVAYHFGQVNIWAVVSGLVALPIVSLAMVVAAVQLMLELAGVGALLAPAAAFVGRAMIWLVGLLAQLPGSAVALRPPPMWLVFGAYGALALWVVRRRLGLSRAMVVNLGVAVMALGAGGYAMSLPRGTMRLTALSAGDGSCLLLRTPGGAFWAVDAGTSQGSSVVTRAMLPALRREGVRQLDGQIVTALDVPHGRRAGSMAEAFHPHAIGVSAAAWPARLETLAGWQLSAAAEAQGAVVLPLKAGDGLALGDGCRVDVLWPPERGDLGRRDLVLLLGYEGRRVLLMDPASVGVLAMLPAVRCDAIVLLGVQRGAADGPLRRAVADWSAGPLIWCGRGPWAGTASAAREWNVDDGAVDLQITGAGVRVMRAIEGGH